MSITLKTPKPLGIYGIPEAARYLAVTPPVANGKTAEPAKLRYWIRTAVTPTESLEIPTRQRFITFRDLISMRLIALLRSHGIHLYQIREAERWIREELKIDWPFVRRPLWIFASDVYIEFEQKIVAAASRSGQLAMNVFGDWLRKVALDMSFDADDMVATWSPYKYVQMDPQIQFGEPCIEGTRIPTSALAGKIDAGDSMDIVAKLYGLDVDAVRHAWEWENTLGAT